MNGVKYYRRKRQFTQAGLAFAAGVSKDTIRSYEKHGIKDSADVLVLVALADALGISVDDLVSEHNSDDLTTKDRATRESKVGSPQNAVNNYRIKNNLRFQELADLLGLAARESARTVCKRKTAREVHIRTLCHYEGLTMDEFRAKYLPCVPEQAS